MHAFHSLLVSLYVIPSLVEKRFFRRGRIASQICCILFRNIITLGVRYCSWLIMSIWSAVNYFKYHERSIITKSHSISEGTWLVIQRGLNCPTSRFASQWLRPLRHTFCSCIFLSVSEEFGPRMRIIRALVNTRTFHWRLTLSKLSGKTIQKNDRNW